jgi:peroxiredoxin Q/BCP
MALKIGDQCPSFQLQNQFNQTVDIANYFGKSPIVIYFYPKDDTPGCTAEACSFRDHYEIFKDLGCEVIGISSDSPEKHAQFAAKHQLTFTLLSDPKGLIRKQFGVPTNLFGLLPGRVTYILDQNGFVRHIHNAQINALSHIQTSLNVLQGLIKETNKANYYDQDGNKESTID